MNTDDFDDETAFFISSSKFALEGTITPLTPLQRREIERLLKAAKGRDHPTVQQLRTVIESHFQQLTYHGDFARAAYRQRMLGRLALTLFMLVAREYYYGPSVCTTVHFREFILAKGTLQQRQQAADAWANGDLQALDNAVERIYSLAIPEFLLDKEYVEQRLWAGHRNIQLTDRLQEAGDWENLCAVLDQDRQTLLNLGQFLEQQTPVVTNVVVDVREMSLEVIKERQSLARRQVFYKSLARPKSVLTKVRALFDGKSGPTNEETTPLLSNKFLIQEQL